jgi:Glycoside hydrolase family 5 C-terminal domain
LTCVKNSHLWGDNWNGEDLSIYSIDDAPLPQGEGSLSASTQSLDPDLPSFSKSQASETVRETPTTLKHTLTAEAMTSSSVLAESDPALSKRGYRAAQAFVRPWPLAVAGIVESFGFDLRACTFTLRLEATDPTPEEAPTEVHLPQWHFPAGSTHVEASGGRWVVVTEDELQKLRWWHAAGEQSLKVQGMVRTQGFLAEGEPGYVEQCNQTWTNCSLM